MKSLCILNSVIVLAVASAMSPTRAGELPAGCSQDPAMLQAASHLQEQLGERHRVCALGSLPARACNGQVIGAAVEPMAPAAQGRVATVARFSCADGTQGQFPLWFGVEQLQFIPLARRAFPAGARVESSDFHWTEQMRPAPGDDWNEDWVAAGQRLVRPLRAGDRLQRRDLRSAATVEAGTLVEARLSQGAVQLQLDAIAMGGGDPGDRIRVKSRLGGRSLPARVTGNHTVELLP